MCHDGYLRWIHSLEDDQAAYSVLSAAEAELVELLNARQQAEGLQAWLEEVAPDEHGTPTVLCVDNMAAGGLATTSPGSWSRLRLETSEGRIQVLHTPGERQVADIGTKQYQDLAYKSYGGCGVCARLRSLRTKNAR